MKMAIFLGPRLEKGEKFQIFIFIPLLDVGGFAKQGIKKYLPNRTSNKATRQPSWKTN
jgi:hypothetical protein